MSAEPVPSRRTTVLVEGRSDEQAVRTLAARWGRDLDAAGVTVVPMGGATNVGAQLDRLVRPAISGRPGPDATVAGLVDEREAPFFVRALRRVGLGDDLAAAGFFVCRADLEDELIRALGTSDTRAVLEREGDRPAYDLFCRQPAQRDRAETARLHRFLGTRSGRKIRYGAALVAALDLDRVPEPLVRLFAHLEP